MAYPFSSKAVVKYVAHRSKAYGSYVIYAYDDGTTLKVYDDGEQVTGTWTAGVTCWWA
jgi:hypothetical protein